MSIHWMTGRGESREAEIVAEFIHNGFRFYVAYDPDFRRLRVYQHLTYGDEASPCIEASPLD